MHIGKELWEIEEIYIMGALCEHDLMKTVSEHEKNDYKLVDKHSINYGGYVEHSAKLQKYITRL